MNQFRWNDWNTDHIATHGVSRTEAEYIVNHARKPYPRQEGREKFIVRGQTWRGDYLQVIYIFSPADVIYVIHARPLTEREKRRYRRSKGP